MESLVSNNTVDEQELKDVLSNFVVTETYRITIQPEPECASIDTQMIATLTGGDRISARSLLNTSDNDK